MRCSPRSPTSPDSADSAPDSELTARFDGYCHPEPNSGCVLWRGPLSDQGYGVFCIGKRNVKAHRFAWERERGPIPAGLVIDHLCRTHACVNTDHLEPVTNRENVLRGAPSFPHLALRTHCKRGHDLRLPDAFWVSSGGKRECRGCQRAREASRPVRVRDGEVSRG